MTSAGSLGPQRHSGRMGAGAIGKAAVAFLACGVLVAGGWFAASTLQSPEQRAASAQAPPAGPVTAPVSRGILSEVISARASVVHEGRREIPLTTPSGLAVVTKVVVASGKQVAAGGVVMTVNDRPVFAVPGRFSFYRDLRAGDTGIDVRQLQDALRASGMPIPKKENSTFGAHTSAAVRALYRAAGFAPAQSVAEGNETPDDASAGLVVPMTELVVSPSAFPVTVGSVPRVGTVLTGEAAALTLAGTGMTAQANIAAGILSRLAPGTEGVLRDAMGTEVPVEVSAVVVGDASDDISGSVTLVASGDTELPREWVDQDVLAVLTLQTVGDESLIVPSRAVAVAAGGVAQVAKYMPDGSLRLVPVTELGVLSGQSAVRPITDGDLVVGDQVQVG